MEKMLQVKLTIFEVVFNGYHECSLAISVGEKYNVRRNQRPYEATTVFLSDDVII